MHVHSRTIYNSQQVKTAQMSIKWVDKQTNGDIYRQWNTIWPKNRMKYRYMLQIQHGSTSKTLCQVKEARHKRSHTVCFRVCVLSRV